MIDSAEGTDHHGQDEGRDTLTAGEAQRTPGGLGTEQEQRLPAMSQNDASEIDKVAGIVAQTRADVGTEPVERIAEVLRQRLEQSGIDLPEDEIEELAHQVSTGDSRVPGSRDPAADARPSGDEPAASRGVRPGRDRDGASGDA